MKKAPKALFGKWVEFVRLVYMVKNKKIYELK